LLKVAREGGQMTPADLAKFEPARRYATLVAVALEAMATVIDELHDRIVGVLFNRARHSHGQQFQQSGKAINDKVRFLGRIGDALLDARRSGTDPFAAIEAVAPWDEFTRNVTEAKQLARPESFDYLHKLGDRYTQLRRYAPAFLDALQMKAAPAAREILDAVEVLRTLNADKARKVPDDAPTGFVRKRWESLVFSGDGVERRFYELCVLAELKTRYVPATSGCGVRASSGISTNICCLPKNSRRSERLDNCRWILSRTATTTWGIGSSA
jgi:hypothetical protein